MPDTMGSAASRPKESTNVRAPWWEAALRRGFRTVGPWAPRSAARLAEAVFFTAPRGRSARMEAALATGRRKDLLCQGRRIATWRWGSGPRIVLLHGWGGRAGQLGAFVAPLVKSGYEVVALDAPGHGQSGGRLTSMVDFAAALRVLEAETGGFRGIVAHSLGAAATSFALTRGLRVERAVFIGPPAGPADWTRLFAERLTVPASVMDLMRDRAERRLGVLWTDLDVIAMAPRQRIPLLVVHDDGDREVPVGDGRAIAAAWPGATFLGTTGLGHRRILRDERILETTVDFLTGEDSAENATREHAPRKSKTMLLEEELFFRSRRWLAPGIDAESGPAPSRSQGDRVQRGTPELTSGVPDDATLST
jgi:pimeloyl-ACP methyl ester carboxylesterase